MSNDEHCSECGKQLYQGEPCECGAEPDDDRCTHSPSAWRSCVRCTDAYGDMMNER